MKLSIEKLMNQLEELHPVGMINKDLLFSVYSIVFFTKDTIYDRTGVIYIGYASDFLPERATGCQFPIICIEDVPFPEQFPEQNMVLGLSAQANLNQVYDSLARLLEDDAKEKDFMDSLYQQMIGESDVCGICDCAKEFLHNPMVVLDNSLKHIGESSKIELHDYIWIDQRKNGRFMSADYVQLLAEQSGYKKDYYSREPVLLPKGNLTHRRIINHIFLNNRQIGTIVIFETEREFSKIDLKLVKILADFLALHMRNNEFLIYSRGVAYEHLFQDLLDGNIPISELYKRIQSQRLNIEENIFIMAVDIRKFDRTYKTLQYFRSVLDEILEDGKSILYNNYIVIVVMGKSSRPFSNQMIEKMNYLCETKKISMGISRCFHDITLIKTHFEQAVTALKLNIKHNKKSQISYYEEFTLEHMIDIASEKGSLKGFCEESLLTLLKYDEVNHTDYANSLRTFLMQERNIAQSASLLHMHRNTLIYRVNKIQEIMNQNLDEANYRFRLLLSYHILDQIT